MAEKGKSVQETGARLLAAVAVAAAIASTAFADDPVTAAAESTIAVDLHGEQVARLVRDADVPVGVLVHVSENAAEEIPPRRVGEADGHQYLRRILGQRHLPFGVFLLSVHGGEYTILRQDPATCKLRHLLFAHLDMANV